MIDQEFKAKIEAMDQGELADMLVTGVMLQKTFPEQFSETVKGKLELVQEQLDTRFPIERLTRIS